MCRMHVAWLLVLLSCSLTAISADYVPGTPGAPWTKDELLVVKSKLYGLFQGGSEWASRILRLGFHDCLKYTDGTGGCDGCLNWKGVGVYHDFADYNRTVENLDKGDNNGLEEVVSRLEKLYTLPDFPRYGPILGQSLKQSGKSRADLWAYASIVAVEFGIALNNLACVERTHPALKIPTCVHDRNPSVCLVNITRPFIFHTGRKDCVDHDEKITYIATKDEVSPAPQDDGPNTMAFFKKNFQFTGREAAALFGAHSFGSLNVRVSLFPYTWTSSATNLFNNDYYKTITGQDRWYFNDDGCNAVGDAFGKKPKTRWYVTGRFITKNGGPVFWVHQNSVCPNKAKSGLTLSEQNCISKAGPGLACVPDPPLGGTSPRKNTETDGTPNAGCEMYRITAGRDEIALNCEMGFYRDFQFSNGTISGCPGMEDMGSRMTDPNQVQPPHSRFPNIGLAEPLCNKQMFAEPPGSQPLYQIMEEFANNQTSWIAAYIPAHEKMIRNGYQSGLVTAPDHFTNVYCPPATISANMISPCYEVSPGTGPVFMIGNRMLSLANTVLEAKVTGEYAMKPKTGSVFQQWQMSESGRQLVNVATKSPLYVNGIASWKFTMTSTGDFIIVDFLTGNVIDAIGTKSPLALLLNKGVASQMFFKIA